MDAGDIPIPYLSRRRVLRMLAFGGAAGLTGMLGREHGRAPQVRRARLMGTYVELQVVAPDPYQAGHAADLALARMRELEARLTRFAPTSEVSQLQAKGSLESASPELRELLGCAFELWNLGEGAFDITVQPVLDVYRRHRAGTASHDAVEAALARVDQRGVRVEGEAVRLDRTDRRITLDGIGKGYIVDAAVRSLRESGFESVLVDAGGDLVVAGRPGHTGPWRIGIRCPRGRRLQDRFELDTLDAPTRAVATSGDYMQPFSADLALHHIVDPRTGRSAPELASATIVAPNALWADGLATLVLVLGARRGRELLESLPGCEGYLVHKDLEVTRTSGFAVL